MEDFFEVTLAGLRAGGEKARQCLPIVDELLKKAYISGFRSYLDEVESRGISIEEAGALREALYEALAKETDPPTRRHFLHIASRVGGRELQPELLRELHLALELHRVASGILWGACLSLDNIGEGVFPSEGGGGIITVERNIKAAEAYLARYGITVPW